MGKLKLGIPHSHFPFPRECIKNKKPRSGKTNSMHVPRLFRRGNLIRVGDWTGTTIMPSGVE